MKRNFLFPATLLWVAPLLCAASEVENPISKAPADSAATTLQEVEIIANRATSKTPIAFTNVSSQRLERDNDGRDLPYLIAKTPSMVSTSDAGAGIGYTSFRLRGSDGSRINVMANGLPLNDPESHSVFWVNMPDLASSLQDVQIQRGVGTSANGAGAFGGSINMATMRPSQEPYARFSTSYGSYNSYKETLSAGTGLLANHFMVDMRLSTIGSDGYIDRAKSRLWSYFGQIAYQRPGTLLRLLAFGGKEKTYMAWDYASKEQMELYGRRYNPCGEYIDASGNIAYYPDQNDVFIQHHLQLLFDQHLAPGWDLNAALFYTYDNGYYEQYKKNRTLIEYGLEPFTVDGDKYKKSDLVRLKFNRNDFGGGLVSINYHNSRLSATLGGGYNQFLGRHFGQVAWVRNYFNLSKPLDPRQEYYRNNGRKGDANVYLRANYDIIRGLSAFADLQFRHIRYTITGVTDTYDYNTSSLQHMDLLRKYNFFNPKLGLNWEFARHHRAFFSWSVAHKEPTRNNFTDCDPDRLPLAERLFDYEAGYQFDTKKLSLAANLYYMDYKNQLVVTGQLSDTGAPMSVNVPNSYRMGIELQGEYRPLDWFDWDANITLSRNRIKNFTEYIYEDEWTNPISFDLGETPIAFSPSLTFATDFNFHYRVFEASLSGQFVSRQYLTNAKVEEQSLDPYFTAALRLGARFHNLGKLKELYAGVQIHNLFNAKYFGNGYAGSGYYIDDAGKKVIYRYSGYAAQAPTNVMATVSINF